MLDITQHLENLRNLSGTPISIKRSTEHDRFFYLDKTGIPQPLENEIAHARVTSDYQRACNQVNEYWGKKSAARESSRLIEICKKMNKRDSVKNLWVQKAKEQKSEYQASSEYTEDKIQATQQADRRFCLKTNEITQIANAHLMQKELIRK